MCVCVCMCVCCDAQLVNTISQSHWEQEAYCFWWRAKIIWGQQGSNWLWKPCKHDISRRETWPNLIFGMKMYHPEYKKPIVYGAGQHGSICENIVNTISQEGKHQQISYFVCWCTIFSARSQLWRSKVIWGQHESICENLANRISQEGTLGQISYLVSWCAIFSARSLSLFVEVKGHLGSTWVNLWKPCKQDISRRETWTDLIFDM